MARERLQDGGARVARRPTAASAGRCGRCACRSPSGWSAAGRRRSAASSPRWLAMSATSCCDTGPPVWPTAVEQLGGLRLELGEVVVAGAHRRRAARRWRAGPPPASPPARGAGGRSRCAGRGSSAGSRRSCPCRRGSCGRPSAREHRPALGALDGDLEGARGSDGASARSRSSTVVPSASAIVRSIERRGSRLPFSIVDTCDGARSMAAASCSSVMPRAVRRSRMRRPSVRASTSSRSASSGSTAAVREPFWRCDPR